MIALVFAAMLLVSHLHSPVVLTDNGGFHLPFKINGTNTFLYRGFDQSFLDRNPEANQDKWELYNRTILNLSRGPVLVGLQFDLDRFDLRESVTRLEKRYLEVRTRQLTVTFGDFFETFGRGTALSVAKTHELYGIENMIDNTVDGARLRYSPKNFRLKALAGSIWDKALDVTDKLYAASGEVIPVNWFRVGANIVRGELEAEQQDADLVGAMIRFSGIGGFADLTWEYTDLDVSKPFSNGADSGRASYLEGVAHFSDLSITAEYKDLENFFFKYSTTPLMEEENQELLSDFFATYPEDLEAFKLRGDYNLPNGILLYGVYAHYNEKATHHPSYFRYDRDINHFFAGFEHNFECGLYLSGQLGRRWEESKGYYYQFSGPTTHGAIRATLPLPRSFGLEAEYMRSQLNGDLVEFQRNKLSVSFSRTQLFVLTGVWESSNLPAEVYFTGKENFYYGQIEIKLVKAHLLRLFYGETRGGVKCSGGVCKYVPAFKGIRFEAVIRF
jgi:hypothetical protein